MKKKLIINSLFPLTVAILSGCSDHTEKEPAVIPINVMTLTVGSSFASVQGISYNGTVQESLGVDVSFEVTGTVARVLVDKGQHVKKGQLLATIDETIYRNQYNAQLAKQEQAEDNYKRIEEVYKEGSIAEVEEVGAQKNLEQALSTAKASYQDIIHCRLYSPDEGFVADKAIEAGSAASIGTMAFKIIKIQKVKIVVPVPEAEISLLKKGRPATININSLNNQVFKGNIDEIGVLATDNSHNYDVKVLVENPNNILKPGMLADVYFGGQALLPGKDISAISVPLVALQVDENGSNFVYIVNPEGDKAIRRQVETGDLLKDGILISKGLTKGDRVIISGYHKITDQTPVHIIQ